MNFRKLKASEIDARVSTVSAKGCSLLLYKDARVDQNILDETVGCMNWQRSHQLIGDRLYCTVSIWDEDKQQWISKQDVGTESYTEKEKGQASDSFKRACFNLGIGRELYTAPFIWVSAENVNLEDKNGKKTTYDSFAVDDIGYDEEGNINRLVIRNTKKKVIAYELGKKGSSRSSNVSQKGSESGEKAFQKSEPINTKGDAKISSDNAQSIRLTIQNNPDKISEEGICKYFKISQIEDMKVSQMQEFIRIINGKEKAS